MLEPAVVEPVETTISYTPFTKSRSTTVVAEPVEVSKRPQGKANEGGGFGHFDRLNDRSWRSLSLWLLSLSKHRNIETTVMS